MHSFWNIEIWNGGPFSFSVCMQQYSMMKWNEEVILWAIHVCNLSALWSYYVLLTNAQTNQIIFLLWAIGKSSIVINSIISLRALAFDCQHCRFTYRGFDIVNELPEEQCDLRYSLQENDYSFCDGIRRDRNWSVYLCVYVKKYMLQNRIICQPYSFSTPLVFDAFDQPQTSQMCVEQYVFAWWCLHSDS
jgi:hypothetical protein